MSKNEKMLESFTKYCKENPEMRFFQALRNWTQESVDADCGFILIGGHEFYHFLWAENLEAAVAQTKDTYHYEDDRIRKE